MLLEYVVIHKMRNRRSPPQNKSKYYVSPLKMTDSRMFQYLIVRKQMMHYKTYDVY